jgi:AraC-like DNA-binding protein
LSPHRNAVAVLALGLDDAFELANADGDACCRSTLIEPNTLHHFRASVGRMAFLYVDSLSRDLQALRSAFTRIGRAAHVGFRDEEELVARLRALADGQVAFASTRAYLEASVLALRPNAAADSVVASLRFLHEHGAKRPSLAELARKARLSPSRYRHRFVALTGVPFRRYRTWVSMGAAMRHVARGAPLTKAALEAGFASSAHFSTTFRGMFGLAPSKLQNVRFNSGDAERVTPPGRARGERP